MWYVKTGATLLYPHFTPGYWENLPTPTRTQRRELVQVSTVPILRYRRGLDSILQHPTPGESC